MRLNSCPPFCIVPCRAARCTQYSTAPYVPCRAVPALLGSRLVGLQLTPTLCSLRRSSVTLRVIPGPVLGLRPHTDCRLTGCTLTVLDCAVHMPTVSRVSSSYIISGSVFPGMRLDSTASKHRDAHQAKGSTPAWGAHNKPAAPCRNSEPISLHPRARCPARPTWLPGGLLRPG